MEHTSEGQYLTVKQVMERLQVSRDTVTRLIAKKELRAKKVGSVWRISQRALDEYMGDIPEEGK